MENGGNRGQNGNNNTGPNLAWDIWDFGGTSTTSSRFDHWNSTTNTTTTPSTHNNNNNINHHHHNTTTVTAYSDADTTTLHGSSGAHALMFPQHQHHHQQQHYNYQQQQQHQPPLIYGGGGGSHLRPDPHLMCLKLGKRQYFEDANTVVTGGTTTTTTTTIPPPAAAHLGDRHMSVMSEFSSIGKRGRPYYDGGVGVGVGFGVYGTSVVVPATVPRCQVEGCDVALVNAKEYHRRHKVCEMHSKAPKVVVLGLEQRFCQQCSRFHGISEFDESKRSCRRRLAGHNERRRKSSHDSNSLPKNSHNNNNPSFQESKLMAGRYPYLASPTTDRALSLLSSKTDSWVSPPDLSSRSSAALRELIAENRAAILSRQLNIIDRDYWHWNSHSSDDQEENQQHHLMYHDQQPTGLDRYHEAAAAAAAAAADGSYKTLDLMQAPPSSAFGLLSVRGKSSKEEECGDDQLWNSLEGANVV